jgi:hypothetical protein
MQLLIAGAVLALVGAVLAGNVGGVANKGAQLNVKHGFLSVNDDPRSLRFTGVMFVVIGVLLAVWGLVHA